MSDEFYHQNLFGDVVDFEVVPEEEEDLLGPKGEPKFNLFELTDALGARNKKLAWVLYQKALAVGVSAEDVFWRAITWEFKTLLVAKKTRNEDEAGMKAYPYKKAKESLRNFKEGELEEIYKTIVVGYHQARRGEGDIETLIEKIVLSL